MKPLDRRDLDHVLEHSAGLWEAPRHGFIAPVARCFAFVGPHLPLNAHWAAGNFIRDALSGGPIRVRGDGTPRRSYLYAADLAIWLWTILVRGESARVYNVGAEEDLGIADLARVPERYVPARRRAREELGFEARIPLAEGIRKTAEWHACPRNSSPSPAQDCYNPAP